MKLVKSCQNSHELSFVHNVKFVALLVFCIVFFKEIKKNYCFESKVEISEINSDWPLNDLFLFCLCLKNSAKNSYGAKTEPYFCPKPSWCFEAFLLDFNKKKTNLVQKVTI